jgi:hypothetical protein
MTMEISEGLAHVVAVLSSDEDAWRPDALDTTRRTIEELSVSYRPIIDRAAIRNAYDTESGTSEAPSPT